MNRTLATVLLLSLPAVAQPGTAPGRAGGLTAAQVATAHRFPHPVVPTYVPRGYHLTHVGVDGDLRSGLGCDLVYRGPHGAEYSIQHATQGIGDMADATRHYPCTNPVLGPSTLWVDPGGTFRVDWMRHSVKGPFYSLVGSKVPPAEVVRVVRSLRYMR